MIKQALGFIEVVGLAGALEAADAAVKAAAIRLLGYELTKGGGMVTIKLCGDVGAVKAAVEAGSQAAARMTKVVSSHVIARPHHELSGIVLSKETVGRTQPTDDKQPEAVAAESGQASAADVQPSQVEFEAAEVDKSADEVCNLCGDQSCSRKKGDPKVTCIHYGENNKEDE